MKKIISISFMLISAIVFSAASSSALADTSAPAASSTQAKGGEGVRNAEDFPTRKAKILQRINEHLAKMQRAQSCVEAASDFAALRACRPQGDKEHDGADRPSGN